MNFELNPLCEDHIKKFKIDMQEAFQQGAIEGFGKMDEEVIPESHIGNSRAEQGSVA